MKRRFTPIERWRGNFTLIEVLVVISIIALLMTLLLPALNKAKMMSHAIACQSNLKQVGSAMAMYQVDFDENCPPLETILPTAANGWFYGDWQWSLSPYIGRDPDLSHGRDWRKNTVFWCRSPIQPTPGVPGAISGNPLEVSNNSYRYARTNSNVNIKKGKRLSETSCVIDVFWNKEFANAFLFLYYNGNIPHNSGANVLFYDLHATRVGFAQIPSGSADVFWTLTQ